MSFAEELRKDIDEKYVAWKEKHDESLKNLTKRYINAYGYASAYCHGYIHETSFKGPNNECTPSDHKYLSKWIEENGFHEGSRVNSFGARSVTWRL